MLISCVMLLIYLGVDNIELDARRRVFTRCNGTLGIICYRVYVDQRSKCWVYRCYVGTVINRFTPNKVLNIGRNQEVVFAVCPVIKTAKE